MLVKTAYGCCLMVLLYGSALAEEATKLRPIMNQPGDVVYQADFEEPGDLDKSAWGSRQGTRWSVTEGVLRGRPSSAEYQAMKADHKGLEPRISSKKTPDDFIAQLSFRFVGGETNKIVPFIEFGHHKIRLRFSETQLELLADHEKLTLATTNAVKLNSGQWYHLLAEKHGEEFVVQFANGPTIYAKHATFTAPPASEADGVGLAGTRDGVVEIDNVTIWSVQPETSPNWPGKRAKLSTTR